MSVKALTQWLEKTYPKANGEEMDQWQAACKELTTLVVAARTIHGSGVLAPAHMKQDDQQELARSLGVVAFVAKGE